MENQTQFSRYKNLLAEEFQTHVLQTPGAVLIDARTPDEFRFGHIPRAINIDVLDECFASSIMALDKTKSYYVYCRSGGRSAHACARMAEQGFIVFNLLGGIGSWTGAVVAL